MEADHGASLCVCAEQDVLTYPFILGVCGSDCPCQSELCSLLTFGLTSVSLGVTTPASHTELLHVYR